MSKQIDLSFIRYANCWEDTNILLEALKIKENEVGLSIASHTGINKISATSMIRALYLKKKTPVNFSRKTNPGFIAIFACIKNRNNY